MNISFDALVDLPIAASILLAHLFHFSNWARRSDALTKRLLQAQIRAIGLAVAIVALCWCFNIALLVVLGLMVAAGLIVAIIGNGGATSGLAIPLFSCWLFREFCFGFPSMVLHPPKPECPDRKCKKLPSVGEIGRTAVPLKPFGTVTVDGETYEATSAGAVLDAGTPIRIVARRNQVLEVEKFEPHPGGGGVPFVL